ncbi:MAG: DUF3791 domain-containing protein [Muribaculaceae bacterium]|nr:DUF3791 domain-containing protein [Muribaculaceae bacterium]
MERNKTDDIAYFIAFCVETYKNAHNIPGAEASAVFSDHGVMEYLSENFEALHTQSSAWILAEIEDFIKADTK